jgi:hypothetical protein
MRDLHRRSRKRIKRVIREMGGKDAIIVGAPRRTLRVRKRSVHRDQAEQYPAPYDLSVDE